MNQSIDTIKECELFPLTRVQRAVYDLLMQSPAQVKHRMRSSTHGVMKAWGIKDIDKSMASFRVITAEEEAASAVIMSLKRRHYNGSEKLKLYNHVHKSSIWYIFAAFTEFLPALKDSIEGEFAIEPDEVTGKITPIMRFKILNSHISEYIYPIPPLGIQLVHSNGTNETLHMLEEEIKKLVSAKGHEEFLKYIQAEANVRNEILYAGDQGVPKVSDNVENFIKYRSKRVFTLHMVCLLIDFYPQKQLLVKQLLEVLLVNLKSINTNSTVFSGRH